MDDDADIPAFDRDGPELLYVQVADHIEGRIRDGELRPGMRLPPERELAEDYRVAYLTMRRATAELRKRQLIRTIHGKGTYVIRKPEEAPEE